MSRPAEPEPLSQGSVGPPPATPAGIPPHAHALPSERARPRLPRTQDRGRARKLPAYERSEKRARTNDSTTPTTAYARIDTAVTTTMSAHTSS